MNGEKTSIFRKGFNLLKAPAGNFGSLGRTPVS
jgi:hypothetical protein